MKFLAATFCCGEFFAMWYVMWFQRAARFCAFRQRWLYTYTRPKRRRALRRWGWQVGGGRGKGGSASHHHPPIRLGISKYIEDRCTNWLSKYGHFLLHVSTHILLKKLVDTKKNKFWAQVKCDEVYESYFRGADHLCLSILNKTRCQCLVVRMKVIAWRQGMDRIKPRHTERNIYCILYSDRVCGYVLNIEMTTTCFTVVAWKRWTLTDNDQPSRTANIIGHCGLLGRIITSRYTVW